MWVSGECAWCLKLTREDLANSLVLSLDASGVRELILCLTMAHLSLGRVAWGWWCDGSACPLHLRSAWGLANPCLLCTGGLMRTEGSTIVGPVYGQSLKSQTLVFPTAMRCLCPSFSPVSCVWESFHHPPHFREGLSSLQWGDLGSPTSENRDLETSVQEP